MEVRPRLPIALAVAVLASGATAGCGARAVELRAAGEVATPTFAPPPSTPADSPHLDVLVPLVGRDTTELSPADAADPTLLAPALASMRTALPDATEATRISVYDTTAHISVVDPTNPAREYAGVFFPDRGYQTFDPRARTDETYPLEGVDPVAVVALVDGIEQRFPTVQVDSIDLRVGLSYDMGLVWHVDLVDNRGSLATVFADLDGTVVAVDPA